MPAAIFFLSESNAPQCANLVSFFEQKKDSRKSRKSFHTNGAGGGNRTHTVPSTGGF